MIGEALPVVPLGLGGLWVWDVYERVGPLALFCSNLGRFRRSQACHGCMASSTIFLIRDAPIEVCPGYRCRSSYRGAGIFWHRIKSILAIVMVCPGAGACRRDGTAAFSRLSCRPSCLARGGIEPVDLFHAGPRDPAPDRHSIFPYSRSSVWPGCSLHPQFSSSANRQSSRRSPFRLTL